ncbi:MAG: acyltransferase family protein [Oscillospiraceae bacterium]|nr:acyltransferase family protein [Oscillospiraceae bacterium]
MENAPELTVMTSEDLRTDSAPRRFTAVDVAKGLLILAVVMSHAWFANSDILGRLVPYSMPAFFFLSGYTYKPGRSYGKSIGKRALQLVVPYVCFGSICNLLYPVYITLSKQAIAPITYEGLWIALAKADAINMLMGTPMWFLTALFTASIIFFALVRFTRDSLWKTAVVSAVLIGVALVIEIFKKANFVWFIDFAPFGAAMMLIGAYCGGKDLYKKLSVRAVLAGIICLAAAMVLNRFFPGSAKTSVVQYIEGDMWYGVLTAFAIAVTGSIGALCVARLVDLVPVLRSIFRWLGQNSLFILCIHYTVILLTELKLFNMRVLSNSIMQVVAVALFGYGRVVDKPKDIVVKILVALFSIGVSAIYIAIHKAVKKAIKSARAK